MFLDFIPFSDKVALGAFLFLWVGYAFLADWLGSRWSLMGHMSDLRFRWMREMVHRDNRMMDVNIVYNLQQSTSFFASTTIFIIAGLLAVLGAEDMVLRILGAFPCSISTTPLVFEFKVLVLLMVFIYAFFKHTWALRQLNYTGIMVGATPPLTHKRELEEWVHRAALLATLAGRHFNQGLRAYYFGLAMLTWFIQPWVFIAVTLWVVLVLYRREFQSDIVTALGGPQIS